MDTYQFDIKQVNPTNYYYFEKGFSKQELEKIYTEVGNLPFEKASVVGGDESKNVRVSNIKWVPKSEEWKWLYDKLMYMAYEANEQLWNFDLVSVLENIQYTEYNAEEEGHYTWHQDLNPGFFPSRRKVSITVQLSESDEYEGGELEYWSGSIEKAPRGAGVVFIFPSYMMHRVTKVTKGTRRSFVLWLGGSNFK
jgi:PKHD-type hydroxylase